MLLEIHVVGLGVIEDCTITFGTGLTALTGETGAGKTLLVDALDLVLGGRPRRGIVQDGRTAMVEARFLDGSGEEVILAREIPSEGRSRAWIDGRMASVSALEERSIGLCDIHGQHEHHSLLMSGAIRRSLDAFAVIDCSRLDAARAAVRELENERSALGGDSETVDRERSILEHELSAIDEVAITDPHELDRLLDEAKVLGGAEELRSTLLSGLASLEGSDHGGPRDVISSIISSLEGYASFADITEILLDAQAMVDDLLSTLRATCDRIDEDPERLAVVDARLRVLHDLCRRYGPTLAEVIAYRNDIDGKLGKLMANQLARDSLSDRLSIAIDELRAAESEVRTFRNAGAPLMEKALEKQLATLALERASVEIVVDGPAGDDVDLLFSANAGHNPASFSKVASGGELARLMLALRLILPGGPPTMVFDEVDAGIGGTTAVTLADALREVALDRQVLVVTHLAQVAAKADRQIAVRKTEGEDRTSAIVEELDGSGRVSEIARMLSGQPTSESARQHARELLGSDETATPPARLV